MKRIKADIENLVFLIKNIVLIDKWYLPTILVKTILQSVTPIIIALFPVVIISSVQEKNMEAALKWLAIFFLAGIILYSMQHLLNSYIGEKNQYVDGIISQNLNMKAMSINLEDLNRRDVMNGITFAKEAMEKIELSRIIADVSSLVSSINMLIGTVYILTMIGVRVMMVFMMVLLTNTAVEKKRLKQRREFDESHVEDRRNIDYQLELLSDYKAAKEIRTFDLKDFFVSNFHKKYSDYENAYYKTRAERLFLYFMSFLCDAVRDFTIYAVVAYDFLKGNIDLSGFYMYTVTAGQMYLSLKSIINAMTSLSDKSKYIESIRYLWNKSSENKEGSKHIQETDFVLSYHDVSFKYRGQDKEVLKKINLDIRRGDKIGIVGSNGAGKTTMIRLLLRMYEPSTGTIKYNGININDLKYKEYMKKFSAVFQKAMILPCSIRENVLLEDGDEITRIVYEDVLLGEKVAGLSQGEHTKLIKNLNSEATNFSGGEEQKLMILRALKRDADIYVLDEPVSALSPRAEYEIVNRLLDKMDGKTAIIISHRLGIIRRCSKIIVLEEGQIIEMGTHEELMNQEGVYKKMYMAQAARYNENMAGEGA